MKSDRRSAIKTTILGAACLTLSVWSASVLAQAPPGPGPGAPAPAAPPDAAVPPAAAPAGPTNQQIEKWSEQDVMNVLDMMRKEFNIDPNRIYLTGHSMGDAGTYFLGAKHTGIWAAVAPVAPASFMMNNNRVVSVRSGRIAPADPIRLQFFARPWSVPPRRSTATGRQRH